MSESDPQDESGAQYRKPKTVQKLPEGAVFSSYTVAELRGRIARYVGAKTETGTPLDIGTLNSIYAYFFGEFRVSPRDIWTTESPGRGPIRREIAIEVHNREPFREGTMDDYVPDPDEVHPDMTFGDFRKQELIALAHALRRCDDQREWA